MVPVDPRIPCKGSRRDWLPVFWPLQWVWCMPLNNNSNNNKNFKMEFYKHYNFLNGFLKVSKSEICLRGILLKYRSLKMFWCFSVGGKCLLSSEKIFICGANLISSPAAVERCTGYHRSCELMNAMTASRTQCWEDTLHPPAPVSWPGHRARRTLCIPQLTHFPASSSQHSLWGFKKVIYFLIQGRTANSHLFSVLRPVRRLYIHHSPHRLLRQRQRAALILGKNINI